MAAEYTNGNANSLQQLLVDPKIEIRAFPDQVLQHLKSITRDVVEEMMATDPAADKIGKAFYEYLEKVEANSRISEAAYLRTRI
jgi:TRAP-type mannitol/chloroaromatic compound transport system substrate-binding protein